MSRFSLSSTKNNLQLLFILLLWLLSGNLVRAQQLIRYIPFNYQGSIGIMDREGRLVKAPGAISNYFFTEDFQYLIFTIESPTDYDTVMNTSSGEKYAFGKLDTRCGALKLGHRSYFHFRTPSGSLLWTAGQPPLELSQAYESITPNRQSWDNLITRPTAPLWALKKEGYYDLLLFRTGDSPEVSVVKNLVPFEAFDLVLGPATPEGMRILGYLTGSQKAIPRQPDQIYEIDATNDTVYVYDHQITLLGKTSYQQQAIASFFKEKIQLQGQLPPPPGLLNPPIYPTGKSIQLNDQFSLQPRAGDEQTLVLMDNQDPTHPILGKEDFDYRYISSSKNLKAFLQIRHRLSGSMFYFDFNGLFFPRGKPLIPAQMRDWAP